MVVGGEKSGKLFQLLAVAINGFKIFSSKGSAGQIGTIFCHLMENFSQNGLQKFSGKFEFGFENFADLLPNQFWKVACQVTQTVVKRPFLWGQSGFGIGEFLNPR